MFIHGSSEHAVEEQSRPHHTQEGFRMEVLDAASQQQSNQNGHIPNSSQTGHTANSKVSYTNEGAQNDKDKDSDSVSLPAVTELPQTSSIVSPSSGGMGSRNNGAEKRCVSIEVGYLSRPSWTQRLEMYCSSPSGQVLTRSLSGLYAMLLWVMAISLVLSNELSSITSHEFSTLLFYTVMYVVSSVGIIFILVLAMLDRLTVDTHYRHGGGSELFMRAGATVLATGGVIYQLAGIVDYWLAPEECRQIISFVMSTSYILFIILEIILILNFAKVHINSSTLVSTVCRFFTMHIIATNVCVWVHTVVLETVEEIHRGKEKDHSFGAIFTDADNATTNDACASLPSVGDTVSPVLFPLNIEYSVVAATMVLAVWEKCGLGRDATGHHHHQQLQQARFSEFSLESKSYNSQIRPRSNTMISMVSDHKIKRKYYNNHCGFVLGYIILCLSVAVIIIYYFALNSEGGYTLKLENSVYSFDMLIKFVCLVSVPVIMYKMSSMTTKDTQIKQLRGRREHKHTKIGQSIHRSLDKNLLTITFFASLLFQMFTVIAARENESPFILSNAIVSMMMTFIQTLFINWYGFEKRATKEQHYALKPGRQGLEVLRCCNLALWAIGTFIVKHPEAKRIHINTFGFEAWMIISNITQPLTILYHFHSVTCIAEIITHAYTDKYIGIRRVRKVSQDSSMQQMVNMRLGVADRQSPFPVTFQEDMDQDWDGDDDGDDHGSTQNDSLNNAYDVSRF